MTSIKLSGVSILSGLFLLMTLYLYLGDYEENKLLLQERQKLKKTLYGLKTKNIFWEKNEENYKKLKAKGWLNSLDRLQIYKKIHDVFQKYHPLQITYQCYPEVNRSIKNIALKSTTIKMKISALEEKTMIDFIDSLLGQFPGVIIPRSLKIKKSPELSKSLFPHMKMETVLDGLEGEFLFEWITLK